MTKFFGRATDGLDAALLFAAGNGHVDTIEALNTFGTITRTTARYENFAALRIAADRGHASVVRKLAEFKLTTADARANKNEAFRKAAAAGHTEVLAALAECFDVRE